MHLSVSCGSHCTAGAAWRRCWPSWTSSVAGMELFDGIEDDPFQFVLMNTLGMVPGDGGAPALSCGCGSEFGEYMRNAVDAPFPWDPSVPARRVVTTVWRGRRLRVLFEAGGDWKVGRVIKFEQHNTGPFARETNWSVSVRFDDAAVPAEMARHAEAADTENGHNERIFAHQTAEQARLSIYSLSYRELQSTLKAMGLPAVGRKQVLATRLYDAWLSDANEEWSAEEEAAAATAAAESEAAADVERTIAQVEAAGARSRSHSRSPSPSPRERPIPPVEFDFVRANVRVGGTLKDPRVGKEGLLLSFQWLDRPVPDLSLGEGVTCPTCRQLQPPTAGEDVSPEAMCVGECPVCLSEAQDCLRLQCSHLVCRSCWKRWESVDTFAGDGNVEDGPEEPDGSELSQEELQTERKRLYDDMIRQIGTVSHTRGGDARNCEHCATLSRLVDETLSQMEEDDNGSRNGLRRLRRRLLTEPIITSMSDHIRRVTLRYGSIAMLRVFVDVIPLRETCIVAEIDRAQDRGEHCSSEEERTKAVNSWVKSFCCRIGELYEEQGKFASAIPWYKRCCSISGMNEFANDDRSHDLSNLGVAQKRAGLLAEALDSYDKAIALCPEGCEIAVANRQTLVREMRHWTGTAVEYDFDDAFEDSIRENLNENSPPYDQLPMGYYSVAQREALPRDRLLAANATQRRKLQLITGWRFVKHMVRRTPSPVIQGTSGASAVILVVGLSMCIVIRSVDVFVFNEWSTPRAVVTATIATLVLDPCSFNDVLFKACCGVRLFVNTTTTANIMHIVRNFVNTTTYANNMHMAGVRGSVTAAKLTVWLLHVVVPLWLHYMQVVAFHMGSPHLLPEHQILVLANFTAVLAFCAAMLRLAARTPWQMAAGAHAVVGTLIIFLLIKCQGDIFMTAPILSCGSESGREDAPERCVALLTGANSGIGYATAYSLAAQGHTVLLACRSQARCDVAVSSIVAALGGSSEERVVSLGGLELSSLTRVAEWIHAQDGAVPTVDVLFLNAGFLPQAGAQTTDGYEAGLGAMHFGHWALVEGLAMRHMLTPVSPRVVVVSSDAHRMGSFHSSLIQGDTGEGDLRGELTSGCAEGQPVCTQLQYSNCTGSGVSLSQEVPTSYVGGGAYARAKLANILYARQLPVVHDGWRAASVHPGMVYTPMAERIALPYAWMLGVQRLFMRFMLRPASAAAAVVLHAAKNLEDSPAANRQYVNGMVCPPLVTLAR